MSLLLALASPPAADDPETRALLVETADDSGVDEAVDPVFAAILDDSTDGVDALSAELEEPAEELEAFFGPLIELPDDPETRPFYAHDDPLEDDASLGDLAAQLVEDAVEAAAQLLTEIEDQVDEADQFIAQLVDAAAPAAGADDPETRFLLDDVAAESESPAEYPADGLPDDPLVVGEPRYHFDITPRSRRLGAVVETPALERLGAVVETPAIERLGAAVETPAIERLGTSELVPSEVRLGEATEVPAPERLGTELVEPEPHRLGAETETPASERLGPSSIVPPERRLGEEEET